MPEARRLFPSENARRVFRLERFRELDEARGTLGGERPRAGRLLEAQT